jgi:hypothetical protein
VIGEMAGELGLQAGGGAEMVKEVGVCLADPRCDRLQRHRLRAGFEQQRPRRFQGGGAAFFWAEAFTSY